MGIWRVFAPRPASVTRTDLIYGGPCYIAGYCPTGEDTLYAYLVEDAQDRSEPDARGVARGDARTLRGLPRPVGRDPRAADRPRARQLHLVREPRRSTAPWNRGRVVLIGDAAHTCPPTLAQGAAQALEDAAVLAELLLTHDHLDDACGRAFTDRRYDRAKTVVEASLQLGQWLLDGVQGDVPGLMARVAHLVAEPA